MTVGFLISVAVYNLLETHASPPLKGYKTFPRFLHVLHASKSYLHQGVTMKFHSRKTESAVVASTQEDMLRVVAAWSSEERADREKKFVRRIDRRLLPILVLFSRCL